MSNSFQSYSSFIPTGHEELFTAGPQLREDSPVHRSSTTNGVMTESTESNISRGDSSHATTEGWQATARSTTGRAIAAADIGPDTLIEFDGMQAKASFWISEGRLTKAADGSFVEGSGPIEAPQEATGDISPIPDHIMQAVNAALDPLPQEALSMVTAVGISVALGRTDDAALTAKFAQSAGIELADAGQRLDAVKAVYQQQANLAVQSRSGITAGDTNDFWLWCRASHQGQLQDAVSKQLHGADLSGYKALADRWLASTPPTLAALQAGGIPTRKDGSGALQCFVQGQWLSPAAAARAGFL